MFIAPYLDQNWNKASVLVTEEDKKFIQMALQIGIASLSARLGRGFKTNSIANALFEKSYHLIHHTQKFHYAYKDFTPFKIGKAFQSESYQFNSILKKPLERLLWGTNLIKDKERRFQEIIEKLPATSPYKIAQAEHLKNFSRSLYQFQFGFDKVIKTGIAAFAASLSTASDYFLIGKSKREEKRDLIKTIDRQYQAVDKKIKYKYEDLRPKIEKTDSKSYPEKLKKYQQRLATLEKKISLLSLLDQKLKTQASHSDVEEKRLLNEYKINFIKESLVLLGSEFISFHILKEASSCCQHVLKKEIAEVVADSSLDYVADPFLHQCFKDDLIDLNEKDVSSQEGLKKQTISRCKNVKHIKQEEIDEDLNKLLLSVLKLT